MRKLKRLLLFICLSSAIISCGGNSKFNPKLIPVLTGEKWGFIDLEGKYIINPQFEDADYFVGEIARVKRAGKFGYITKDGKYLVNPQYKEALCFSEGLAAVVPENGKIQYIDQQGKMKFELSNTEFAGSFHNGLAKVLMGEKWGFIDQTGKVSISANYEEVGDFVEGYARFKAIKEGQESQWGYLDKTGKVAINSQFQTASHFSDGLAKVSIDGKTFGFIDYKGKYVINPQFDEASDFSGGIAAIKQGDSWGLIDQEGKIIVNPQFENMNLPISNGLISVESNGKWGYIDKNGKYAINPQFDVSLCFIGKVALIRSAKKVGLIDKDGKYIVNPQFDDGKDNSYFSFFGEGYSFDLVQSNFFDSNELIGKLFSNNHFIGLETNKNNVKDIVKLFHLKPDNFSYKKTTIRENEKLNEMFGTPNIDIRELQIEFRSDAHYYDEKYEYRTDYWGQRQRYYTGTEKVFIDTTKVSAMSIKLRLKDKALLKEESLSTSIKNKFKEIYNLEEIKVQEEKAIALKSKDKKQLVIIHYGDNNIQISFMTGKASVEITNNLLGIYVAPQAEEYEDEYDLYGDDY